MPIAAGFAAGLSRPARSNSPGEAGWLSDPAPHPPAGCAMLRFFFLHITLTVRLFLSDILLLSGRITRMTEEKTTRELGLTRRTGT